MPMAPTALADMLPGCRRRRIAPVAAHLIQDGSRSTRDAEGLKRAWRKAHTVSTAQ